MEKNGLRYVDYFSPSVSHPHIIVGQRDQSELRGRTERRVEGIQAVKVSSNVYIFVRFPEIRIFF